MKKFFLLATVACLTMASCEDVPAPYELFDPNGDNGQGGTTESSLPYTDANLSDWNAVTVKGAAWSLGSTYAKASGYANGTTTESEAWLVSPAVSLKTDAAAAHIEMEHVIRYVNASTAPLSNHTMWIATDFAGDVATATWKQLDYKPVESATQTWDFYAADQIAIPAEFLNQTVYVAFKFVCGSSSTTWEIKNFSIKTGAAVEGGTDPGTPDTPDVPLTGAGSKAEPYNVASAQGASGNAWVKGYIVGFVDGQTYATGAKFEVPGQAETEILIADAADCTDPAKCMPIQLPAGDIRSALELSANPSLLKQEVQLFGSIEKYFGVTGLKSTSCAILGDKMIGKDPEDNTPDTPTEGATGTGTAADPFNVAGVLNYTKALAADVNSSEAIYFKGKVSNVKEISTKDAYNNATFYISDDGTNTNEFYIFRCLGLNKADIESADLVKVGDEVMMCGKVVNYKGNTPETVQKDAYIVSINGEGGSVNPGDNPGTDPNPGTNPDAGDYVTFDMSANFFGIDSEKQTAAKTYTNGAYSITLTPAGEGNGFYYNSKDKYVILGKQDATLEFGAFDFAVEKIEVTGRDAASGNTKQNIYVGETAVSTQTTGVKGTNTYVIAEGSRAAGTKYVLKVESAHNTQFTSIKIYKAQ